MSYSIFLDKEANSQFAYAEIKDLETWEEIANTDVCQKWWKFITSLMIVNEDERPKSIELQEVFHIEYNDWNNYWSNQ